MDKRLIAKRFSDAIETYTREARVQHQIADKMIQMILSAQSDDSINIPTPFKRIFEFGCGTGYYTRKIAESLHPESFVTNDLCEDMETCIKPLCNCAEIQFVAGDAEALPIPSNTDMITSCSVLQWFKDPLAFFSKCHTALNENGIFAFSTFGERNMQEIRRVTNLGLNYMTLEKLKCALSDDFEIIRAEEDVVLRHFDSPMDVLKHLKMTGVGGFDKSIWTRGKLLSFCDEYSKMFTDANGKVSLTYNPIYIIAKKR